MSLPIIIVDTGPLVAFLNQKDKYHSWVKSQVEVLAPPFYTCEAVLTEVSYLLQQTNNGSALICRLLERHLLKVSFQLNQEYLAVAKLMQKYQDVPMSLADACVVRMSEVHPNATVFTLNNDFTIYRKQNRHVIPLLYPEKL